MLEELVKKIPGAEVSDEGKITINGKEIKRLWLMVKSFSLMTQNLNEELTC